MSKFDNTRPFQFTPTGAHSSGTDISSAAEITIPDGAQKMLVQVIDQNARFTLDGTTPTTSSGFQLVAGRDPIIIPISDLTTVTFIEETATASLQYQFGY